MKIGFNVTSHHGSFTPKDNRGDLCLDASNIPRKYIESLINNKQLGKNILNAIYFTSTNIWLLNSVFDLGHETDGNDEYTKIYLFMKSVGFLSKDDDRLNILYEIMSKERNKKIKKLLNE